MSFGTSPPEAARIQWRNGDLHVAIRDAQWSVPREALGTLIHLLEAGRALDVEAATALAAPAPRAATSPAVHTAKSPSGRRSRKRVGDALVVWMEQNTGWHHEEALLQIVIDHEMTDASPRRALKIALGKQRGTIFNEGANGFWKLVSDLSAGPVPEAPPSPTLRQRILATPTEPQTASPGEAGGRVVRVKKGESRRAASAVESPEDPQTSERWTEVSRDEVARARRNLLGLGSSV